MVKGHERRPSAAGRTASLIVQAAAALHAGACDQLSPDPADWVCPSSRVEPTQTQIEALCGGGGGSGTPDFGEPVTLPAPPASLNDLAAKNGSPSIQLIGEIDGEAKYDRYYSDPKLTGADQITYRMTLDPAAMARVHHVNVTLYNQSIPPGYLQERFRDANVGPKQQDDIQRLFYLTSHLNTAATDSAGDTYIKDWKLAVADACQGLPGSCQP